MVQSLISVSQALFALMKFCVSFCIVSTDSFRILFLICIVGSSSFDRLVGLVVKASSSRAEDPGYESRLRRDFFGYESYQ